jgi:K+-dependent Na+/Ca+ exchanger related-protein
MDKRNPLIEVQYREHVDWVLLGIPFGIVLLYFGSEWMVEGAKDIALRLGVSPFVIGLTIVALGSSSPEAVTSVISASNPDIIIGNIVGSNIANVGLVIGASAVIGTLICRYETTKFELAAMVIAVSSIAVLSLSGMLGFYQGIILLAALVVFILMIYYLKKDTAEGEEPLEKDLSVSVPKCILMVIAGMLALYFGADVFVDGAVFLADELGVSELMIGLLVVAIGSCLPELCICLMASYKGEREIVISNVIGSVIFNSFFALGLGALLTDIPIADSLLTFHMPVMIILSVILFVMIRTSGNVTRAKGILLLCVYVVYIAAMAFVPNLTY